MRGGFRPCPHGLGRITSVRTPYRSRPPPSTPWGGCFRVHLPEALGRLPIVSPFGVGEERPADLLPAGADADILAEDRLQLRRVGQDGVELPRPDLLDRDTRYQPRRLVSKLTQPPFECIRLQS